jgi:prophage maintenance system killer protein
MSFDRTSRGGSMTTSGGLVDDRSPGKQTLVQALPLIQRAAAPGAGSDAAQSSVHAAAERGTSGASTELPYRAAIQQAFGPHDVSKVQAHVGGAAAEGTAAMGARAFAVGDHVAFGATPDLHTAAHEAAHVVQQRGGVQLAGGVGEVGDPYERNADQVADRVVAGHSAADLLTPYAGGGGAGPQPGVQRIVEPGAKTGMQVFVTRGDGQFTAGTIVSEVPGKGYRVSVDGHEAQYSYAQLNSHDPRAADASLGDDKWREYVRGNHQDQGPTAYDNDGTEFGRKLPTGTSYGASMTASQNKVSGSLGVPMSPGYVQDLHDTGSAHLSSPPDWRSERSGNSYDGRIGVTLLDAHADNEGVATARQSKTMEYHGRQGGEQRTHSGQMELTGPPTHRITTAPMSSDSVKATLTQIMDSYDQTIAAAHTRDQILDAIARFTQELARLHPFEDANTRTNMLLLNKLLAENGLPLAIVDDPKNFYLNKLSAWRAKIEAGMAKWQSAGGKTDGSAKGKPMSSVARGKQPERAAIPHDGLDIEIRPLSDLFKDDPDGLAEVDAHLGDAQDAVIAQRAAAIRALQAEVAELNQLFGTYASLVARASDGTGAAAAQVDRGRANLDDAHRHLT